MTVKNLDYWRQKIITSSLKEIVSDIESLVVENDAASIAYGFLAIVEGMGVAELNSLTSFLFHIMEHMYILQLCPQESEDFQRNQKHWNKEIRNWRNEIRIILRNEPSLKTRIPELIKDNEKTAKKEAIRHLDLDMYKVLPTLRSLSLEEILPTEDSE